ncbi:type III secretion system translocator chaperone SicA [Hafnia paralvei]|uniref:type III secretion system translocator chaperone SicA n=1 Tax=Hafnia paralvei TaxID=546367 RepID=UPI00300C79F3
MVTHSSFQKPTDKTVKVSEHLLSAIQSGATLKDVHDIPESTMQAVYRYAYEFYQQGRLKDAESLFRFLCVYDFYNPEYVMGLAAVYQIKKNYEKAVDFYALAYSLGENDYRPMFYAGQCNLLLKKATLARHCFNIVVEKCDDSSLVERSQNYLAALTELTASKKAPVKK